MAVPQNEPTLSPYQQRIANLFNGNTFRRSCGKKRFTCTSLTRNISEFPALEDYLPKNYDYHVCDFDLIRETGDHVDFKTTFRMVLSSKEDIKLWMKSHAVTWRVDRTYVTKGQKVIFKVDYRCQRNTRPRRAVQVSGHSKNTDCPAMMCVKLFRTQVSRGRQSISTDSHLPTFPTMVSIMNEHNHNIGAPESLPCLVSDIAEYELEVEIGDDYAFAVADGTLSPTPEFSYGWLEDPGAEVVVEDVEQNASEEASHQMAALEFDAMCQKLSEIVKSDESFAAPAAAAVNAFKKIERNPFRIAAALRTFARDPNAGSPSAKSKGRRGAARGKAPSRGRRRLAAERPAEGCFPVSRRKSHVVSRDERRATFLHNPRKPGRIWNFPARPSARRFPGPKRTGAENVCPVEAEGSPGNGLICLTCIVWSPSIVCTNDFKSSTCMYIVWIPASNQQFKTWCINWLKSFFGNVNIAPCLNLIPKFLSPRLGVSIGLNVFW